LKAVSPQACISDFFFDDFHPWRLFIELLEVTLFGPQKLRELPKIGLNLQMLVPKMIINFS
jgi:hypothetical protein